MPVRPLCPIVPGTPWLLWLAGCRDAFGSQILLAFIEAVLGTGEIQAQGCDAPITRSEKERHEQTCPYLQVLQLPLLLSGLASCLEMIRHVHLARI